MLVLIVALEVEGKEGGGGRTWLIFGMVVDYTSKTGRISLAFLLEGLDIKDTWVGIGDMLQLGPAGCVKIPYRRAIWWGMGWERGREYAQVGGRSSHDLWKYWPLTG